jgi:hypothetical protein
MQAGIEKDVMALAERRWQCVAHRIPETTAEHPNYLFTRAPSVEAIGVAHYREIAEPFQSLPGIDCVPALWERGRFMASALAFVLIVAAPDGVYFATIKDFDKDALAIRPRQMGMDSRAKFVVQREKFKELKPDGAKIGPGYRSD